MVLLIIPKVELALFDASACAHCLDGFALLCIITPIAFFASGTAEIEKALGGEEVAYSPT